MLAEAPKIAAVGETAYRRIRTDIIFGRLSPGQKLKLDRMKERYGTSVSTLRELLTRLSSEGLIVAEGLRGFEVPPVSGPDLREIAALRLLLEHHALRQSFVAGDMEWEGRVVAAHHKLSSTEKRVLAGNRGDVEMWKQYDWQFHQALISACGSRVLMETHGGVFDKYLRYQMLTLKNRGEISVREHRMMLDCALKRDAESCCKVLTAHIEGGVEFALASGTI
jgi:DNA-binding GntR family transcriptional regulator